jgi:CubicO group peptidase (beta-lactamase class C family)
MNFRRMDTMMRQGLTGGVFPGAVLLVATQGKVIHHRAYGFADLFSRRPMTVETAFDLASLTKPLATTVSVMRLVQEGRLNLDRPLVEACPELSGSDKAGITVRQLLSHSSGMPAWQPFFMKLRHLPIQGRTAILRQWLKDQPLTYEPGQGTCYSDLGFLLLQWVVETCVHGFLEQYVFASIYKPLGVAEIFVPGQPDNPACGFAATELCPWRNRLLVGEIHDDNAFVLEGLSAHAGLFGTARGVFALLNLLLQAERNQGRPPVLDSRLVQTFFMRQSNSTWALGFDTPAETGSSAGVHFSPETIGHLGFTGTSFWADRRQDIVVVLLTNRVHPSRHNTKIRGFRPALHDLVMEIVAGR